MEYTKLGQTGLDVSRICLGCMSYGGGNLGNHAWSLPEEESRPFEKRPQCQLVIADVHILLPAWAQTIVK
jgi:hypothetical protein